MISFHVEVILLILCYGKIDFKNCIKATKMQDVQKIKFKMYTPSEELRDFVQTIWFAELADNCDSVPFKILTDCGSGIVYNFGGKISCTQSEQAIDICSEGVTLGPSKNLLTMTFNGKILCVGIRFFPATGHHFFSSPMNLLTDTLIKTNSDHFAGNDTLYNRIEHIYKKNGAREKIIEVIEVHLIQMLLNSKTKPQSLLINILKMIHIDHTISLNQISEKNNISIREIQRLFRTYIGVSPKVYMRFIKVKNAKTKIANKEYESLTQLSLDSGYFDQAHFIRDFKSFMEETPKKYHKLKHQK